MEAAKREYLAVDDCGTGGIWFVVIACDEAEIRRHLPSVKVYAPDTKPKWMSDELLRRIAERRTFDIDTLPESDWMRALRRA
jgi:hypothetical protein